MEEFAKTIALHLSTFTVIIATFVIVVALVQFIYNYSRTLLNFNNHVDYAWLRIKFGGSLAIALELLLAADILVTAVAPTWEEIGKLAAIVVIRTTLNYFLEKEIITLEKRGLSVKSMEKK
ncbi:MAG: DUF1622 domain-containing protein [Bacteroidia bacterium]